MFSTQQLFNRLLSEAYRLFRKEGLLEAKKCFFTFAPLLFLKLASEPAQKSFFLARKVLKCIEWQIFSTLEPKTMLQILNQTVLPTLVKTYHRYTDFLPRKSAIQNPETLKKLVDKLSALNLSELDSDILGDTFEYFLHQGLSEQKAELGIYFTPRHIVKLILDLVELRPEDKIYDPTCGAGGFLVEAFKRLKEHPKTGWQHSNQKVVFGREISDSIKIAQMNLLMAGANPSTVCQMDTLKAPLRRQFSVVLANFPFSQKTNYGALYGFKGKDANPVFLKHIMDALKPNGIAAVRNMHEITSAFPNKHYVTAGAMV